MRALITGAEGFVGPYLISFLEKQGIESFGTYLTADKPKNKFYHMDVTNGEEVSDVIKKIKPDFIFHLAGFSSVKASFDNPELCMKINVDGTRNILNAVYENHLSPRILIVSSAEVYGKPKFIPITENHPIDSTSPYGESRIAQELLCREYVNKGLFIVITRSFNHTGPGQTDMFVIPTFAKQIALIEKGKQKLIKVGNLDAVRDFSDVRDVVRAYYLIVKKGKAGDIYNVCSGEGHSIKALLEKLISLSTNKIIIKKDLTRFRPSDIPELIGNNLKLREEIGWQPEIEIEKLLKDTLNYWREKI